MGRVAWTWTWYRSFRRTPWHHRPNGLRGEVIVKLVNYSSRPRPVSSSLASARKLGETGRAQVITADLQAQNSLGKPPNVAPTHSDFWLKGSTISYTLAPNSFTVLRVAGKK